MSLPYNKGSMIRCDCCREQLVLREALYDAEMQDFVCGDCAIDLNSAMWALHMSGYTYCSGKKVSKTPMRPGYEGYNL